MFESGVFRSTLAAPAALWKTVGNVAAACRNASFSQANVQACRTAMRLGRRDLVNGVWTAAYEPSLE